MKCLSSGTLFLWLITPRFSNLQITHEHRLLQPLQKLTKSLEDSHVVIQDPKSLQRIQ